MLKIKVVLYGVGAVGRLIADHLLEKEGVEIVGAIDLNPKKVNKDLGETLGINRRLNVGISDNAEAVLGSVKPDIVVHATTSHLRDVYPQLEQALEYGANIVSTCEELSYPYCSEPQLAERLDILARKQGASVLGTGINPGFLMDTLVIALTGACKKVDEIKTTRIIDAATRRVPFQRKIGAGLKIKEFNEAIRSGSITGHVGLEQSISMIAAALSWRLTIQIGEIEPVLAKEIVASSAITVDAGCVAGIRQVVKGLRNNQEAITLEFQAYIGAEEECDQILIKGEPNINQKIVPCIHGDKGTVAMIVNAIPRVINARPGLLTMKDIPILHSTSQDLLNYISKARVPNEI